jgi:hypothetical protein
MSVLFEKWLRIPRSTYFEFYLFTMRAALKIKLMPISPDIIFTFLRVQL